MEYYNNPNTVKKRKETIKVCKNCDKQFIAKTKTAVYCGDACRQNAYNERNLVNVLSKELKEREIIIPGLEILLESHPDDIEIQKLLLYNKGKIMLLKDRISKLQK